MRKIFVSLIFCLCTACNVGPESLSPEFYSDEVIARELHLKSVQSIPFNWYREFNDDTLNYLVATGLNNSKNIEIARSKLLEARANLQINKADFLPQIGLKGGYQYQKASDNIGVSADSHYYNAGFDASWEIDIWGKGRRQTKADEARVRAAAYNLQNVQNVLAAEIALNYVYLRQNQEKLRLAKHNLQLQKDVLNTMQSKFDSGLSDSMAYSQAQYLYADTVALIPQYMSNIETYTDNLSTLIGVLPSQLPPLDNTAKSLFKSYHRFNSRQVYNLPAYVIRLRPDVAVAEQNLIAQNENVGKAVAELYPDVSISALWGFASQGGSKLFDSGSQTYQYAPLVTLPLLDWNRLKNNVELQKYILRENLAQYEQTVLNAVAELKNSSVSYQKAIERNQSLIRAENHMRDAVKSANDKYINGLIEFSDFLSAQQDLIKAQNDAVDSRAAVWQNLISYYKASGAIVRN